MQRPTNLGLRDHPRICGSHQGRDFNLRAIHEGPPPKVIFLTIGNRSTPGVADLLRNNALEIAAFLAENVTSVMVLPK